MGPARPFHYVYGITISYRMTDASGVLVQGAISGQAFYRNSFILLSLIGNVETVQCKIIDQTGNYDEASYGFTFTRQSAEELLGEDVRRHSDNADGLRSLIDRVNSLSLDVAVAARSR